MPERELRRTDLTNIALVACGWAMSSFLEAHFLWSTLLEQVLAGLLIGSATAIALVRDGFLRGAVSRLVLPLMWITSLMLPPLAFGQHPPVALELIALGTAGVASGVVADRGLVRRDPRALLAIGCTCAASPLFSLVAVVPCAVLHAPLWIIDLAFGLAGGIAGTCVAVVMFARLQRMATPAPSPRRASDRADRTRATSSRSIESPAAQFRFEAFISYRNEGTDPRWARWLQRRLEAWRTPASLVRATGAAPRLLPCFMDESELVASADLTAELKRGLDMSRFLIVICSPRTLHSRWIPQEVAYFTSLGRSANILMLLVEGELTPLLPVLVGNPGLIAEPLAADVRALGGRVSAAKRRLALLKLIASMLGVGLDDLRRRNEQRRRRRILSGALAAFAVVLGTSTVFTVYRDRTDHLLRAQRLAVRAQAVVTEKPARSLALATLALKENVRSRRAVDERVTEALFAALRNNSGSLLVGHASAVRALAFSGDESWLVTGDFDGRLGFWRTTAPDTPATWIETGHHPILSIDASSDGRWIAAGGEGVVMICDLRPKPVPTCSPSELPGLVITVAFDPAGNRLVAGGKFGAVHMWQCGSRDRCEPLPVLPTLPAPQWVFALRWSPTGEWLAASTSFPDRPQEAQDENPILLWRVHQEHVSDTDRIETPKAPASLGLQFSRDGKWLIAGDEKGVIRTWRTDVESPFQTPDTTLHARSGILSLAIAPSGKWFVTGEEDGNIEVWDLNRKNEPSTLANRYVAGRAETVRAVAISPHDDVAVGSSWSVAWNGQYLYDAAQVVPLGGHEQPVTTVAFSATGRFLATADFSGAVRLREVSQPPRTSAVQASQRGGALSPDGRWFASQDSPVQLYGATDHFRTPTYLQGPNSQILDLVFSPDASMLVARAKDAAWWWSLDAGDIAPAQALPGVVGNEHIVFSRDGQRLATVAEDGTGIVWKRSEGHLRRVGEVGRLSAFNTRVFPPGRHMEPGKPLAIAAMSFSGTGRWLAMGGANGVLTVWDTDTSSPGSDIELPEAYLDDDPAGMTAIQWIDGPSGEYLVTGSGEGTVTIRTWKDVDSHNVRPAVQVIRRHAALKGMVGHLATDCTGTWLAAGGGVVLGWVAVREDDHVGLIPDDHRVVLWRTQDLASDPVELRDLSGTVSGLAFDCAHHLLAASTLGPRFNTRPEIRFWDLSVTPTRLMSLVIDEPASGLVISHDGRRISGRGLLWSFDPQDLLARARMVGRNLTPAEWSEELGNAPYEKVFDDRP